MQVLPGAVRFTGGRNYIQKSPRGFRSNPLQQPFVNYSGGRGDVDPAQKNIR
jgi:hypothetical protein